MWYLKAHKALCKYLDETQHALNVGIYGKWALEQIGVICDGFASMENLMDVPEVLRPEQTNYIRKIANEAKQKKDISPAFLYAHALVSVWSALEVFIEDMIVDILINDPDIQHNGKVKKVKIPILEFESANTC